MKILNEEEEKLLADFTCSWDRFKPVLEKMEKDYQDDYYLKTSTNYEKETMDYRIKQLEDWIFKRIPKWLRRKEKGIRMSCIFCNHIWIDKNDGLYTTCPECGSKYCDG